MRDEPDKRIAYGDHPDQFVDLWSPQGEPCGTAVLIHGGYWRQPYGLDLMDPMAAHLRDLGWQVLNIEYRRIRAEDRERQIWSEMSADVVAAVSIESVSPLIAIGHSAGGHLALWAATHANLDGVIALAPVADLRAADELNLSTGAVRELLGGSCSEVPAQYVNASPLENLPLGVAQLIVHGDADDLVPLEISTSYTAAAKAAGDEAQLLIPSGTTHMELIDPADPVWRAIDQKLAEWSTGFASR